MAESTGISWTRSTFNPWIGCTKVSPGCDACYAETVDRRFRYGGAVHWGPKVPRFRTKTSNWKKPLFWNSLAEAEQRTGSLTPKSDWTGRVGFWPVFCASLADVFDNEVPQAWRDDLWDLVDATPHLTWLVLTKRIGNVGAMLPDRWSVSIPKNVALGITVVNQEEADRDIPKLLRVKCRTRWISYEPALGPIEWRSEWVSVQSEGQWMNILECGHGLIDWVIVGGESNQGGAIARPFDLAWARSTVNRCREVGVPVFVKQLGSVPKDGPGLHVATSTVRLRDRAGADPTEWPEDLRVREFPF